MQTQLTRYQNRVNNALKNAINSCSKASRSSNHRLYEAIEYSTLNQGKRIRPAFVYAVAEALSTPLEQVDSCATAIELIHSYSLVHDDLPAMDNDALRRGLPTCHIQYDEAIAILVGDAQQTLAFQVLSEDSSLQPKDALEMILLLSKASGANGMIEGQVLDILAEGKLITIDELKQLHHQKTGALIQCALLLGAVQSSNYPKLKPGLLKLGELIGLAFQVQDDILDIESDTQTLGKPQGSDIKLDKSTYPKLLGLLEAKQYRDNLIVDAKALLVKLKIKSLFLNQLIDYIAHRNH